MPGLHDVLALGALEPLGELGVGDDVPGAGQRLVPLGAPQGDGGEPRRQVDLLVADGPQVGEGGVAGGQFLVDGARRVGVLAPVEAAVEHGVTQRPARPLRGVRGPQRLLLGAAPVGGGQGGAGVELEPVVVAAFDEELAAAEVAGERQPGVQDGRDVHRGVERGVGLAGAAQEHRPVPLGERQGAAGPVDGLGGEGGGEARPVAVGVEDGLLAVGAVDEDEFAPPVVGGGEAPGEGEGAARGPGQLGDDGPHGLVAQFQVAGGVGADEQFAALAERVAAGLDLGVDGDGAGGAVGAEQRDAPGLRAADGGVGGEGFGAFGEGGQRQFGGEGLPVEADRQVEGLLGVPVGGAQPGPRLRAGGRGGGEVAFEVEGAVLVVVGGEAGGHVLGAQPQPPGAEGGPDPAELPQVVHGQPVESGHPDRPGARQQPADGGHLQLPGGAGAAGGEPGRVDDGGEPGPVVAVQGLPGAVGGLPGADRADLQRDDAVASGPQPQGLASGLEAAGWQVADVGVAGEVELAVLPVGAGDAGDERQVAGAQPGRGGGQRGAGDRVGGAAAGQAPDLEGVRVGADEGHQVEEFGQAATADEGPLGAQVQGEGGEGGRVGVVGEGVGVVEEGLVVGVVAVGQRLHEHPEVAGEDGLVVAALGLGPVGLEGGAGGFGEAAAEEGAGGGDGGRAVVDGAGQGALVADGAVPVAPEVHGVAEDVDAAGEEVGGDDDGDVLEEHPFGEGEGVLVPEVLAEHLVAGDPVAEQVPVAQDVGGEPGGGHGPPEHRRLLGGAVGLEPVDVAGDEVGAAALQGVQHQRVGVLGDDVVAVDEGEVRAGGVPDAGVAGGAEARVLLLDQAEPGVPGGVGLGDPCAGVRRTVVDHDDLQVPHRLPAQ